MKRKINIKKFKGLRIDFKKIASLKKMMILLFAGILLVVVFIKCFFILLENLPYFNIKKIDIATNVPFDINDLEGQIINKNIFKVDLVKLKETIQKRYPQLKFVRIIRIIPNKLLIEAKMRIPAFQFRFGSYFTISQEGIVLMKLGNNRIKGLIEVVGLNPEPKTFKVGANLNSKRFVLVSSILKELYQLGFLRRHPVNTVDVTDPKNTILFIEGNIEVRMGFEDFGKRLKALGDLLNDPKIDPKKIRYIDLRFKDVIIGPR